MPAESILASFLGGAGSGVRGMDCIAPASFTHTPGGEGSRAGGGQAPTMNRMSATAADYNPRYLAGILLFNARDFFEAHDVWEELWADCRGP